MFLEKITYSQIADHLDLEHMRATGYRLVQREPMQHHENARAALQALISPETLDKFKSKADEILFSIRYSRN